MHDRMRLCGWFGERYNYTGPPFMSISCGAWWGILVITLAQVRSASREDGSIEFLHPQQPLERNTTWDFQRWHDNLHLQCRVERVLWNPRGR
eukprot:1634655-Amphidinium_carterae.1